MERDYAIGIVQREAERVLQLANAGADADASADNNDHGSADANVSADYSANASADNNDNVGAGLTARVPSCPEWDFAELVKHLGNVYNWVGTIVEGRLPAPPSGADIPTRPDGMSAAAWLSDRLDRLLDALKEVPADAAMWNFSTVSPGPSSFWWRRQLHETAIHRVDAELTCSQPVTPLEPDLAADNVSELFELHRFAELGTEPASAAAPEAGTSTDSQPAFIVHLHATDIENAEWTIDTVARAVSRAHAKGDVAIRGTSWALARWCWGRPVGDEIEAFGDIDAAETWRRLTLST
jgi:uncharacterized protein (TIGR03083 family)